VVYLARHGRTHMNRILQIGGQIRGDGLDPLGFKQRVGLFLLLRDEPMRAVFTSELLRSRQTAAPLAAHFEVKPIVTADLNEFAGGVSEGICYSVLGKRLRTQEAAGCDQPSDDPLVERAVAFLRKENKRRFKVGVSYRWPGGGESLLDVDRRLNHFLRSVPATLRDQAILIVGHSGTNRFLLAKMMGWKMLQALRIRMGHTNVFRVERRAAGQPPRLSVYRDGAWHECREPATFKGGLPCLPRRSRSRSAGANRKSKPRARPVHRKGTAHPRRSAPRRAAPRREP